MKQVNKEKQEFKLTLCQDQAEWERFNQQYKQGLFPDNQVYIKTVTYTYQSVESEKLSTLPLDI